MCESSVPSVHVSVATTTPAALEMLSEPNMAPKCTAWKINGKNEPRSHGGGWFR